MSNCSSVDSEITSREYLARRVWSSGGGKYVVKQVERSFVQTDKVTFLKGIIDLALGSKVSRIFEPSTHSETERDVLRQSLYEYRAIF